jgi:hypothetical protein
MSTLFRLETSKIKSKLLLTMKFKISLHQYRRVQVFLKEAITNDRP